MEKFTFFWKGPFSQWYPATFTIGDGNNKLIFTCAEQYMMYRKALLFGDTQTADLILSEDSPAAQKALGRRVKNFNKAQWDKVAKDIVYAGNYAKFTQNPKLLDLLKQTVGTTLVEASPYDTIWGVGRSEDDPLIKNRKYWRGTNWLGEVLTKLRDNLIEEENNDT